MISHNTRKDITTSTHTSTYRIVALLFWFGSDIVRGLAKTTIARCYQLYFCYQTNYYPQDKNTFHCYAIDHKFMTLWSWLHFIIASNLLCNLFDWIITFRKSEREKATFLEKKRWREQKFPLLRSRSFGTQQLTNLQVVKPEFGPQDMVEWNNIETKQST